MLAPRGGPNIVELDRLASTADMPIGIIAADCPNPREIDDGVYIEALPSAEELYRVGVCVADTSKKFQDGRTFNDALTKTTAEYFTRSNGTRGYKPMIDESVIRKLEFSRGNTKNAMIVSFVVGPSQYPSDLEVKFGKVIVESNMTYKRLGAKCRYDENAQKYGRASSFIINHLRYKSGGDTDLVPLGGSPDDIHRSLIHVPTRLRPSAGSTINESFMIAANHLVARLMATEGLPAIYRVHDPNNNSDLDFLPPDIARYSTKPGKHAGLELDLYCRVTSPLRRLEDFVMSHILRKRFEGIPTSGHDERVVQEAVRRLNLYMAKVLFERPPQLDEYHTLGTTRAAERKRARTIASVIPITVADMDKSSTA